MRKTSRTYVNNILKEGYVYEMEHAGFSASIMKAPKLKDNGRPHGLPPGERLPIVPIANLPGCPESWLRGPGSYVCPVDTNWGLWFDWTMNDRMNTAVLPSVKGMNPITGRALEGPTLESYQDRCPIHDEPFGHDLLCEKCGYRWPSQNYVTHESTLWLDGFRQPDGTVRQFFFSEDDKRDIASLVIGKENTMPAFGFVFYRTRENRMDPCRWHFGDVPLGSPTFELKNFKIADTTGINSNYPSWTSTTTPYDDLKIGNSITYSTNDALMTPLVSAMYTSQIDTPNIGSVAGMGMMRNCKTKGISVKSLARERKTVSVGAGAEIRQDIVRDGLGIDGWEDEPTSIIRLYFCFEEQFRNIVESGGVCGIQRNDNGFLHDLPVG